MQERLNAMVANPAAYEAMSRLQGYIKGCGLEFSLMELVKIRASQINGCAFCLHMHTGFARRAGESETRLYLLDAWRESQVFTPRERAALAWTESVTRLAETGAQDDDYREVSAHFTDAELVDLTLLICVINSWNRLSVGFRRLPELTEGEPGFAATEAER